MYLLEGGSLLHMAQGRNAPAIVIFVIALAELGVLLRVLVPALKQKNAEKRAGKGGGEEGKPCEKRLRKEHEKRFRSIEEALYADVLGRKKWRAEVDRALREVTLQACVAVMYNPAPALEQFHAAITYFKLHGNGNGQEHVAEIIMKTPNGIVLWKSALNEDMKRNGPCEDRYFREALEWIEKHVA